MPTEDGLTLNSWNEAKRKRGFPYRFAAAHGSILVQAHGPWDVVAQCLLPGIHAERRRCTEEAAVGLARTKGCMEKRQRGRRRCRQMREAVSRAWQRPADEKRNWSCRSVCASRGARTGAVGWWIAAFPPDDAEYVEWMIQRQNEASPTRELYDQ